jgi:hypothetical protein
MDKCKITIKPVIESKGSIKVIIAKDGAEDFFNITLKSVGDAEIEGKIMPNKDMDRDTVDINLSIILYFLNEDLINLNIKKELIYFIKQSSKVLLEQYILFFPDVIN